MELFIAKRIYSDNKGGREVSRPAVLISMIGIAIGLAVMILAVAIVIGFKNEVQRKVIGFGSHIQITNFDAVRSYETRPIAVTDSLTHVLYRFPEIAHVQRFSTKPGIIKTDDAFQGVVLKGVGPEFDPSFFLEYLIEGEIPMFSDSAATNQVVISQTIAQKLNLKLEDRIFTYFFEEEIRTRRLTVKGIYQTNSAEYDNAFILTDIYTVNRLNNWKSDQVTGLEIRIDDYSRLEEMTSVLMFEIDNRQDKYGESYYVRNIQQINPQIFDWLSLLDFNIWLILIIMVGVAGFTMISGLLIIIIERTNMIGLLKALGATDYSIRKIFLWFSIFLIGKGMLLGNAIGLGLYFIQKYFRILKLDPVTYYVDTVPVSINIWIILLINVGTLLISVLMLLGPSYLITKINPATSMRYE
ncbi:ABC transporter permease [Bacteroides sp. 519]|uniref:ABC transporter permease n=1 Tax=Bacteroides sp. 519 TaxID=2302937 RepID=UPI0013D50B4F|nr:ABC transporter permease [Bacteroides sp. 519]NDV59578.1 ABC transporter permease [Bacteroides sp. 519]